MKSITRFALLAAIVSILPLQASAATVKIGTIAPDGSPWHVALREMGEAWQELSGGRVQVRIYANGVAGNEPDMVRKMRIGQLHAAALSGGEGLSQIAAELRVFETPMLIRSNEELDFVRAQVGPQLTSILAEKGFRVLDWSDVGWVYLFTTSPVVGPADAKSLRIRIGVGDTTWASLLKDSGYRPVPLPVTEIHTGLQSGLIDGFATPPVMALSTQWFGLAKHMTDMKWAPLTGGLVITEKAWQGVPEELREPMLAAARKSSRRAQGEIRRFESEAIKAMQQYGLEVHQVAPEVLEDWEAEIYAAYPRIVGTSVPTEIFQDVERIRDRYRAAREGGDGVRAASVD